MSENTRLGFQRRVQTSHIGIQPKNRWTGFKLDFLFMMCNKNNHYNFEGCIKIPLILSDKMAKQKVVILRKIRKLERRKYTNVIRGENVAYH